MTTDTALAPREMSLAEIGRRIQLNKESGWGLEKGTSAQLNLLALYCQKHSLLPGDDVTLYEGKPWITIDGRIKLMRRHPDYRGHSTRPLTIAEKEAWGYDPDDLVVEATVRTATCGEIQARGKVSKAERLGQQAQGTRNNPVAKHHPVEMAEKRALSRAERYTFGTDSYVDDEETEEAARTIIQERRDPERIGLNAAAYDRIMDVEADENPIETANARRSRSRAANTASEELITSVDDPRYQQYVELAQTAAAREIEFGDALTIPVSLTTLNDASRTLEHLLAEGEPF